MKQYKVLFIIMIMMLGINVKALDACTTEKMNNLKEVASKIEFNYTYEMKETDGYIYPEFTITATNLNEDLKALIIKDFYTLNYREFVDDGTGRGKLTGFVEGQNVTVTMKAYTVDECSTRTVLVKQVKLPYYNRYYDKEFCLTNPNFKYCSEFTEKEVTLNGMKISYSKLMIS